jgi:hypothetical protein
MAWGGSEMGTLFLLSELYGSAAGFSTASPARLVAIVVSKIVLFIMMRIIIRIRLEKHQRIPQKYFLGLMLFPVSSILSIAMLTQTWVKATGLERLNNFWLEALASISLLFANLFVFALFDRVTEETQIGEDHSGPPGGDQTQA